MAFKAALIVPIICVSLSLCPCVVFRAWDSALVEFDSRQIVPVLMRSRTCYGVGVYYKKYIHIYIYVYIQIDR